MRRITPVDRRVAPLRTVAKAPGFRDLSGLPDDLRAGRITQRTLRLAVVLDRVLNAEIRPDEIDAELGLRRTRGRPPARAWTAGDLRTLAVDEVHSGLDAVCQFIWNDLESGPKGRGARARALSAAEARFGKDHRTIERAWRRAAPLYSLATTLQQIRARMRPMIDGLAPFHRTAARVLRAIQTAAPK